MNIFRRTLCLTLSLCMALSLTAFAAPQTYEGEAKGFYDGLKVAVTINDGVIELVEVIENNETAPGQPALEKIPQAIVAAQSIKIDTIAGATRTSEGILAAGIDRYLTKPLRKNAITEALQNFTPADVLPVIDSSPEASVA